MAKWSVEFSPKAEKDIAALDKPVRKRVIIALEWLVDNFDVTIPMPLGSGWKGFFKLRVGDWRIIYKVDTDRKTIIVHYIDHRSRIYKRRS